MARLWGGDGASADGSNGSGIRPVPGPGVGAVEAKGVSGRLFVVVGCIGVLVVWGLVYLAFSGWKARYEELAQFGKTEVAPLVDGFRKVPPEGVDPRLWDQAVTDTHTMLVALTSSGLLDKPVMTALRDDVRMRVERSKSLTSLADLAALWDDLETRAGPVISSVGTPVNPNSRHANRIPRPARPLILPVKEKPETDSTKPAQK